MAGLASGGAAQQAVRRGGAAWSASGPRQTADPQHCRCWTACIASAAHQDGDQDDLLAGGALPGHGHDGRGRRHLRPAVGSCCLFARAGVGVVLTQSWTDPWLEPRGLALLAEGVGASDAVAALAVSTPDRDWRRRAAYRTGCYRPDVHARLTGQELSGAGLRRLIHRRSPTSGGDGLLVASRLAGNL